MGSSGDIGENFLGTRIFTTLVQIGHVLLYFICRVYMIRKSVIIYNKLKN